MVEWGKGLISFSFWCSPPAIHNLGLFRALITCLRKHFRHSLMWLPELISPHPISQLAILILVVVMSFMKKNTSQVIHTGFLCIRVEFLNLHYSWMSLPIPSSMSCVTQTLVSQMVVSFPHFSTSSLKVKHSLESNCIICLSFSCQALDTISSYCILIFVRVERCPSWDSEKADSRAC